jgi:hypothetical protein
MATSSPRPESEISVSSEFRSLVLCRQAALAVLLAASLVGGAQAGEDQDYEDFFGSYSHRVEGVTVGVGDATASNAAAQIINPWPAYSRNRHILSQSERMIGAIRRYQTNSAAKPLDVPKIAPAGAGAPADAAATPDAPAPPSSDGSAGQ